MPQIPSWARDGARDIDFLAIPTAGGIVLASDGQQTTGDVSTAAIKLFRLSDHCAWAGAGEVALIQRVSETIGPLGVDQPLINLRDQLANAIKQCVNALLQLDFRTQFFATDPAALLSLHKGDFVFVTCRPEPRILHITSYGTPEWIDGPFAIGSGRPFAYALLQKYQGLQLTIDQASVLAFKVIEEAIAVGAYGLGLPIHVWHTAPTEISVLDEANLSALSDTARSLRDQEIRLLVPPIAPS